MKEVEKKRIIDYKILRKRFANGKK